MFPTTFLGAYAKIGNGVKIFVKKSQLIGGSFMF